MNEILKRMSALAILTSLLLSRATSAEEGPVMESVRIPIIRVQTDEVMTSEKVVEQIDLERALARALESNIELALARAERAIAETALPAAGALFCQPWKPMAGFLL